MSRSNPTKTSPVHRYFKWKGGEGKLTYWDKEKEEEVEVKLPFEFFVLDELHTISGYCDSDESMYWANEVKSLKEPLTVRTSKGQKDYGVYRELDVTKSGARYAKSIYFGYGDEMVIGNLKATGAFLSAWIEFSNNNYVERGKVVLVGSDEAKKGATTYHIPKFEYVEEENEQAMELDKELQQYLSDRQQAHEEHEDEDEDVVPTEIDDSLFKDKPKVDTDDEVSLDQIPF